MSLNKIERRERIKMRIRKIVSGTPEQPRMTVYRSNKQIYVQFIDDLAGVTLATASSLDKEVAEAAAGKNKCDVAALVGKLAAERAAAKGISTVTATCITEELNSWPKQHAKAVLNSKRLCQIPT